MSEPNEQAKARWIPKDRGVQPIPPEAFHIQPASLRLRVGAASDKGMIREADEDSLLALNLRMASHSQDSFWGLFIVADGMGGHEAGEIASALAIRGAMEVVLNAYLASIVEAGIQHEEEPLKEIVRKAILQANEYVLREARAR